MAWDFQGKVGITSIVLWKHRLVIFGVPEHAQKNAPGCLFWLFPVLPVVPASCCGQLGQLINRHRWSHP